MVTRNLMCVSSACEASGRKVLWCDIYAITPERSLSSAQSATEALLSMGLLIGICALKVSVMNREQNKTEKNKYLQQCLPVISTRRLPEGRFQPAGGCGNRGAGICGQPRYSSHHLRGSACCPGGVLVSGGRHTGVHHQGEPQGSGVKSCI